jgi:ligand-binding sensor domain-containing protein/serine phosphatase RsbU (regulator of sigma subunit)
MSIKLKYTAVLFFIAFFTKGQSYNFKYFGNDNGLKELYVYTISQSGDGFLYLTTGESVYRYDGRTFEDLKEKREEGTFITEHLVDSRNILWIGHNQSGVSFYRNGVWKHLRNVALQNSRITAIKDYAQHVIIATNGAGLFSADTSGKITQLLKEKFLSILAIESLPGVPLLIGTPEGCYSLKSEGRSLSNTSASQKIGKDAYVKKIVRGAGNYYFVLYDDNSVDRFRYVGDGFQVENLIESSFTGESEISTLFVDRAGTLWLGVVGEGLWKVSVSDSHKSSVSLKLGTKNGFTVNHITCIFQDRENNFWYGTFGEGLVQRSEERFSLRSLQDGLLEPYISCLAKGKDGSLWLGSGSKLASYHPSTNTYRQLPLALLKNDEKIRSLLYVDAGLLWIGTTRRLLCFQTGTGRLKDISAQEDLSPTSFNSLLMQGSELLAGTMDGLYRFNATGSNARLSTMNEGLLHNSVLNLFSDSQQRLWIASHGAPVYYLKDGMTHSFKDLSGYNSFKVNSFTEDHNGNIWIATDGDGVFKYDGDRFKRYSTSNGLLSDFCHGIVEDDAQSLWIAHSGGLSELSKDRGNFSSYDLKSAYPGIEINSDFLLRSGSKIMLSTSKGLLMYDSDEKTLPPFVPPVSITGISFNNRPANLSTEVNMPFAFYSVRISFVAVILGRNEIVNYHYRIPEIDSTWRSTTEREVDIPKLGDGRYTFEVLSCVGNGLGMCNEKPASIVFTIEKPVWKKAWFYILLVCGLGMLTYLIIELRTRQFKKMQMLLQLKVKQKTFLLNREKELAIKIKGELEHRNKDMTDSINYARNIQLAILPTEETMENLFGEDFFVLFRPKDIVSGDFYWAAALNVNNNNKNDLALAAVIDCTGHGVPGAFLSIMANDVLKQSIIDRDVNNTNEILDFLNHEVTSHLNPTGHRERLKDGMDVALVGIERRKRKLYFSGANNPAYVMRKNGSGIETFVLKATKQAIGSVSEDVLRFELKEFDLLPGDTVYLFSDGYADQFGGDKNKKFTYKRFREVLGSAYDLPMHDQKEILQKQFAEWSRGGEQTDDVCVMGIRIK